MFYGLGMPVTVYYENKGRIKDSQLDKWDWAFKMEGWGFQNTVIEERITHFINASNSVWLELGVCRRWWQEVS